MIVGSVAVEVYQRIKDYVRKLAGNRASSPTSAEVAEADPASLAEEILRATERVLAGDHGLYDPGFLTKLGRDIGEVAAAAAARACG